MWSKRTIGLFLVLAVTLAFARVLQCDFINLDDPKYVTANPHVRAGLTTANFRWALVTTDVSLWHPLTWLSHMLDVQLFGLTPAGHHLTSLCLHAANVLLLFLALVELTHNRWRSAIVSGLFGLHPLRVESVAWVAERKDVLSLFFALLTIIAYVRFVRSRTVTSYLLVLGAYVLALMSKPMMLTLPAVLLLLDYWPLRRLRSAQLPRDVETESARVYSLPRLCLEKLPLCGLAAAATAIGILAARQNSAIGELAAFPASLRAANALVSYTAYVGKTVWPQALSVFYPYPSGYAAWKLLASALFLTAVTIFVLLLRRSRPYAVVGWLWFLGTLLPVIGLIQAGSQAMADRFTYFPHIGLFIVFTWGLADIARRWRLPTRALLAAMTMIVVAFGALTHYQVQNWMNSKTLFTHALKVTSGNWLALNNLADALVREGDLAGARTSLEESLRIFNSNAGAHYNLGVVLAQAGNTSEAIEHYRAALRFDSLNPNIHNNLGLSLLAEGNAEEAVGELGEALRLRPDGVAEFNLALALNKLGNRGDAVRHLQEAIRLIPNFAEAHYVLADNLVREGRKQQAEEHYALAVRLRPALAASSGGARP